MPDLDVELLERVARWCADAGRITTPAEIRRALSPLGWDELLAARSLLVDPPPARPLGPFALADLARGAPADVAAEREREGRYPARAEADPVEPVAPASPPRSRAAAARKGGRQGAKPSMVIRRARDAAPPPPPATPALPLADELLLPEGRNLLERLVRRHGARRAALVAALAAGWRTPDGRVLGDPDLSRLLEHHGLARTFARRERDELLHALRAAGGLRSVAAARLGLDRDGLDASLARTGATPDGRVHPRGAPRGAARPRDPRRARAPAHLGRAAARGPRAPGRARGRPSAPPPRARARRRRRVRPVAPRPRPQPVRDGGRGEGALRPPRCRPRGAPRRSRRRRPARPGRPPAVPACGPAPQRGRDAPAGSARREARRFWCLRPTPRGSAARRAPAPRSGRRAAATGRAPVRGASRGRSPGSRGHPARNRSGTRPDRSGTRPDRSGARPDRSGARPDRSGARPDRSGARPDRSGARPDRSGVRPVRPGSRPERSGARPGPTGAKPTGPRRGGPPRGPRRG